MILTTHILSGAAIGANVKSPYLVVIFSIVLHFLLDLLPHGDYLNKKSRLREFWKVAVDLIISFSLIFGIIAFKNISDVPTLKNIFIGIFFSILPDGTTFLYIWMKMKFLKPVKDFHEGLHYFENGSPRREFHLKNNLWDIAITVSSIFFLMR
jgi:hypothetical protein